MCPIELQNGLLQLHEIAFLGEVVHLKYLLLRIAPVASAGVTLHYDGR